MKLELLIPEGTIQVDPIRMKPRPASLDNRTVLLFWNAKHNGDVFLNKIAELLVKNIPGIRVVKAWQVAPETARQTGSKEDARRTTRRLIDFKPDVVIGSQGD
ncbi:MAG: hypothetical protein HYX90_07095 [Chloroflexi bacterium]|nr:hypothetical protein [Chloroflexota bacterium]